MGKHSGARSQACVAQGRLAGGRPRKGGWAAIAHPHHSAPSCRQGPPRLHMCGILWGRFCWEADDWGCDLQLRVFVLLFRLEKVYNLVKEAMPKKLDGQSGVEGVGWAGPYPDPDSRRAAFLGLVRALPGRDVGLSGGRPSLPSSPSPQTSAEGLSSGKALPQGLRLLDSRAVSGFQAWRLLTLLDLQGGYWQGLSYYYFRPTGSLNVEI